MHIDGSTFLEGLFERHPYVRYTLRSLGADLTGAEDLTLFALCQREGLDVVRTARTLAREVNAKQSADRGDEWHAEWIPPSTRRFLP